MIRTTDWRTNTQCTIGSPHSRPRFPHNSPFPRSPAPATRSPARKPEPDCPASRSSARQILCANPIRSTTTLSCTTSAIGNPGHPVPSSRSKERTKQNRPSTNLVQAKPSPCKRTKSNQTRRRSQAAREETVVAAQCNSSTCRTGNQTQAENPKQGK